MIRDVRLRLVQDGHEPGPPLGEPLRFGLQDRIGAVHAGVATDGEALRFDLLLTVKGEDGVGPVASTVEPLGAAAALSP